jgi:DNA polymerase-3 subunit delta'
MDELLIRNQTASDIQNIVQGNAHAILLSGPEGAGKITLGRSLIVQRLGLSGPSMLAKHPYYKEVTPIKGTIGIDDIRDLQRFLQLKTTGNQSWRRAVLIADSDRMTIEAQNALLKSLEEPPNDTALVLTAQGTLNLKPTIYSRVQRLEVLPIDIKEAVTYFSAQGYDVAEIEKAYAISGGYAGLLTALISEDQDHVLYQQIDLVKNILTREVFERLKEVDTIARQKQQLPLFFQSCRLIYSAALKNATEKGDKLRINYLIRSLKSVYAAEAALGSNPNVKLLLTNLMLNI